MSYADMNGAIMICHEYSWVGGIFLFLYMFSYDYNDNGKIDQRQITSKQNAARVVAVMFSKT